MGDNVSEGALAPKKRKRREYSDSERAAAVICAESEGLRTAARRLRIPVTTLSQWYHAARKKHVTEFVEEHRNDLALALESTAWNCLAQVKNKVADAPLNHLVSSAALAVEKAQLLKNKPTNINRSESAESAPDGLDLSLLSSHERAILAELIRRIQARQSARPPLVVSADPVAAADTAPAPAPSDNGVSMTSPLDPADPQPSANLPKVSQAPGRNGEAE